MSLTISSLLDACGLRYRALDDGGASLSIATGPADPPTSFRVHHAGRFVRVRALVEACTHPTLATLTYLNELNAQSPLGASAAWSRDEGALVLTVTWPAVDGRMPAWAALGAALTAMHEVARWVRARKPIQLADVVATFGGDLSFDGLVTLDRLVERVRSEVPLRRHPDGSHTTHRRYQPPAFDFFARLSTDPAAGLCVDALAPGDPTFPYDEGMLRSLAELNGYLPHGSFALWTRDASTALLVHRYALPLPWLATDTGDDAPLLSASALATLFDHASGAWEDVIRIVQGGPVLRP